MAFQSSFKLLFHETDRIKNQDVVGRVPLCRQTAKNSASRRDNAGFGNEFVEVLRWIAGNELFGNRSQQPLKEAHCVGIGDAGRRGAANANKL